MSDDKIKSILNSDASLPKKPTGEWSQIVKKIDQDKKSISFKLLIPSFIILVVMIVSGIQGTAYYQEKQDRELVEFLLETDINYDDEEQSFVSYF